MSNEFIDAATCCAARPRARARTGRPCNVSVNPPRAQSNRHRRRLPTVSGRLSVTPDPTRALSPDTRRGGQVIPCRFHTTHPQQTQEKGMTIQAKTFENGARGSESTVVELNRVVAQAEELLKTLGDEGGAAIEAVRQRVQRTVEQAKTRLADASTRARSAANDAAQATDTLRARQSVEGGCLRSGGRRGGRDHPGGGVRRAAVVSRRIDWRRCAPACRGRPSTARNTCSQRSRSACCSPTPGTEESAAPARTGERTAAGIRRHADRSAVRPADGRNRRSDLHPQCDRDQPPGRGRCARGDRGSHARR